MKAEELKGLSKEELNEKLQELEKQLMELQFKRRSGVEKPHLFKHTKRGIARILTVLKEKEHED
ncbi:MAG: 50S ribosomal protein L29 [Candidatus Omnitrophota bacterium]|nr:MAG: 50S ribosomal protein L29 [Candidatus Omnitrophota bacterium]